MPSRNLSPTPHAKALKHLTHTDPVLGRLIRQVDREHGTCDLAPEPKTHPYQALVRSVVYQQLHGKAAATILGRVIDLFKPSRFPTPQALLEAPVEKLRGAGLSRAKTAAIQDIAKHMSLGNIPSSRAIHALSNEQIIEQLTQIRGVGPWTVEMLLIFKLGRLDVLPVSDFGVRKGFQIAYRKKEMPTPKQLALYGGKWAPYRSIAAWYLWRANDLPMAMDVATLKPKLSS